MTKKAIAHKVAWWQIWVIAMLPIIVVAFYQLCVVINQGAVEKADWEEKQQKIAETKQAEDAKRAKAAKESEEAWKAYEAQKVEEAQLEKIKAAKDAEQAEDAMRAFLGKKKFLGLLPMGWWYKGRAHNLAMVERHWAKVTVWQYIYFQDILVIGIVFWLIGLVIYRSRKKSLDSELNKSTSVGKVHHPDLPCSSRGMRLSMFVSVEGFFMILFVREYTVEVMLIVWMLLLLGESIRYKLKGGKLDFNFVPEVVANIGRIASRLWKKLRKNHLPKRRRRRSKSKRRIRGWKDIKFWFT